VKFSKKKSKIPNEEKDPDFQDEMWGNHNSSNIKRVAWSFLAEANIILWGGDIVQDRK